MSGTDELAAPSEPEAAPVSRWRQPALAVGFGAAALLVGHLAPYFPMVFSMTFFTVAGQFIVTLLWPVGAWAAVTAFVVRVTPPRTARGLSIAAAPVVSAAVTVVETLPMYAAAGASALWFAAPSLLIGSVAFLVCAVIGWTLASVVTRARRGAGTAPRIPVIVAAICLIVGGVATVQLIMNWLGLYFTLFNTQQPEIEPFGPAGIRYLVTAALAVGCTVAAALLARRGRATGLTITAWILVPFVLLIAFATQVPQGRFTVPEPERDTSFYTECSFDASRPGCGG